MTLIVPSYGGGVNLERTIDSCRRVCDETVIISTALFDEDKAHFQRIADQVVQLPWNYVFHHGHGELHNQATGVAKNDWLLLLGTAETWAHRHFETDFSDPRRVYRCDHLGDPHSWKRIWNRTGGTRWSGIMHEEIEGGTDGGILFRMQDTEKMPGLDPFKDEARKWIKALSYNWLYLQLREHPERLGATNPGWLSFVKGCNCVEFCQAHEPMIRACVDGDRGGFLALVAQSIFDQQKAQGVNFKPQGYEALINQ